MNHDFDLVTEYCRRCGAGALDVAEGARPRDCEGGGNMVAISHLARGGRLRDLLIPPVDRSYDFPIPGQPFLRAAMEQCKDEAMRSIMAALILDPLDDGPSVA